MSNGKRKAQRHKKIGSGRGKKSRDTKRKPKKHTVTKRPLPKDRAGNEGTKKGVKAKGKGADNKSKIIGGAGVKKKGYVRKVITGGEKGKGKKLVRKTVPGNSKVSKLVKKPVKKKSKPRRKQSKTEKTIRGQRYRNNKKISDIQKEIERLTKHDKNKFLTYKGKKKKVKTHKEKLLKEVWEINEVNEELARKIERLFNKGVKRKIKYGERKKQKGVVTITFNTWLVNDVHEYILVQRRVNSFDGIDIQKHANQVESKINFYFSSMNKYDLFLLEVHLDDLSSFGNVLKNG